MTELFKKLQFKNQETIVAFNAPSSFDIALKEMMPFCKIEKDQLKQDISFAIVFVTTQQQIASYIQQIDGLLIVDAVLWFCYPKASSKKYSCDFNRDKGWEPLGDFGWEGVRMVAIDEDWSALRFRKTNQIKLMNRRNSMALSAEGKKRTEKK